MRLPLVSALSALLSFFLLAGAAPAAPLTFVLDPSQSFLDLDVSVDLFGGAVTSETQCTGCLSTDYSGTIEAQNAGLASIDFPGGGLADADVQRGLLNIPRTISPAPGGGAGGAPADYGLTVTAPIGLVIPPFEIPGIGSFDLGTLEAIDFDIALRDVTLEILSQDMIPVAGGLAGTFDASLVDLALMGALDANGSFVLQAANLASFLANVAAFNALALALPGLGLEVGSNLFALEVEVGFGFAVPLDGLVVPNQAGTATLDGDGIDLLLTLPVDFDAVPEILAGLVDIQLGLSGQLVGTAPFAVPEPGTAALLLAGLAGFAVRRRGA